MVKVEEALCAQIDPELFFPDSETQYSNRTRAKEICAVCPLTYACLKTAVDNKEQYGIWGGATSQQRKLLKTDEDVRVFIAELRKWYKAKQGPNTNKRIPYWRLKGSKRWKL